MQCAPWVVETNSFLVEIFQQFLEVELGGRRGGGRGGEGHVDPFDMQFDINLFSPKTAVIG